ncbi:virulence factor TspB C-terminal domain-related protein [Eikenella corrodens]|nr:virulence factor TspB C-terminal domain-related protein [Eikenella corrodens]
MWFLLLGIFLLFPVFVYADVPAYPPQNVPSLQTLAQVPNGVPVNYKGGRAIVNLDDIRAGRSIRMPQYSRASNGAGGITGYKTNPVNLYDNYGNVARGQIQTQTNLGQTSTVAKAGAALYGAQVIGSAAKHQGPAVGEALGRGDYTTAAQRSFEGVLQGMRDSGDSVLFGGISGVESAINAYQQAKNPSNAAEALAQASAQKAQETAKRMQQQYEQSKGFQDYLPQANGQPKTYPKFVVVNGGTMDGSIFFLPDWYNGGASGSYTGRISFPIGQGQEFSVGTFCRQCQEGKYYTVNTTPKNYEQYRDLVQKGVAQAQPQPTIEDFLLTQAEAQNVLAKYMEQMLNDNNRNHTELMNALWAGGGLNPGNTQSMVMGSPGDNTFLTEPYTPVGSNQAQQTQFTVNKDGTVTQTIVQRPDLAANTSQAPTRAEVGQQQSQQDTRPAKSDSTAEKPDVCAQNPNSMMCAPMGNTDYQDIVLPQQNINIALSPLHIFNTDAACPAPTSFNIAGTSQSLSYEPMCDTARKARPFVIMMAMTAAFLMVFSALNRR